MKMKDEIARINAQTAALSQLHKQLSCSDCLDRDADDPCDAHNPDYDPTPWCSYGHKSKVTCDCGPRAEND